MRNRFLDLTAAALVGLSLAAAPVGASTGKFADAYFAVRERATLAEAFTLQEVQTHPEVYNGKLIEVRGMVSGVARSANRCTFLIGEPNSPSTLGVRMPEARTDADWPFLEAGRLVRLLCRVVVEEGSSSGFLEIVVAAPEPEAASREKAIAAAKKAEAERKAALQRRSQPTSPRMASRRAGAGGPTSSASPQRNMTREQVLAAYTNAVLYFNRRLGEQTARHIAENILAYSNHYGLDARLVMAVIACESNFNPSAVSRVGAMGLGQLMPGTASGLGVRNPWNISENLEGSTRLLRRHIQNFTSDGRPTEEAIKLALACYNAGAGAVRKYRGIPPYRETQQYVRKITRLYRQLCGYPAD